MTIPAKRIITIRSLWPVCIPFLVFVLHALLFRSWLVDDAGISFAYARNFIHGFGLVSQAGVEPVEGFSNPLWTLLISPIFVADPVDPTVPVKLLSMGLILGMFFLVAAINRFLFDSSWWAHVVTAATLMYVSLNTSFVVWTISGLENPLYVFLLALYVYFSIVVDKANQTSDSGRLSRSFAAYAGIVAAGLFLTRPDGAIFLVAFPLVLLIRAAINKTQWKNAAWRFLIFLVFALVPIAAYLIFRLVYFGDLYPNTYHSKGGPSPSDLIQLFCLSKNYIDKTNDLLFSMFAWQAGFYWVLCILGAGCFVMQLCRRSVVVLLLPFLFCCWALYVLLPPDWMGEYRFATPFFLMLPLILFALLADVLVISTLCSRVQRAVFVTVTVLFLIYSATVYVPRSLQFAQRPTVAFDSIARRFGIAFNMYADDLGISDASLLAPDVGGTLYFSLHRIYDLAGLCDRKIAPLIKARDTSKLVDYIFSLSPTFIHVHDYWSLRSGLYSDDRFRLLYAAIRETPSTWAEQQGHTGIYSGDYVRRDALASMELLEKLRRKLDKSSQHEHSFNEELARPFPRG